MNTPPNNSTDYQAEMRRAAGLSVMLAVGAAAAVALAAYLSKPDAPKVQLGPSLDAVDSWLKNAANKMRSGAKAIIEEIDSQG
jgi:hypothetical protein